MTKLILLPVRGYEDLYDVDCLGNVYSKQYDERGKIMNPAVMKNGYFSVNLSKNGKKRQYYIHRLVAEAFIPNPNNYPVINHKDENKQNNAAGNLEWCTQRYNVNYGGCLEKRKETRRLKKFEATVAGKRRKAAMMMKQEFVETHHYFKKEMPILQFTKEMVIVGAYSSETEASKTSGIPRGMISAYCNGLKSSPVYVWRFGEIGDITNSAQ